MPVRGQIGELVARRASLAAIRKLARDNGMVTLGQDAQRKVAAGWTSATEAAPLLALLD